MGPVSRIVHVLGMTGSLVGKSRGLTGGVCDLAGLVGCAGLVGRHSGTGLLVVGLGVGRLLLSCQGSLPG